jgi:hypothetical protein
VPTGTADVLVAHAAVGDVDIALDGVKLSPVPGIHILDWILMDWSRAEEGHAQCS